jgi:hypothetical protein
LESKHAAQILLAVLREATSGREFVRLLERTEEAIPPSDITVIEPMDAQLVMDRMMLGPLNKPTKPGWSV